MASSLGGKVAVEYAVRYPEQVARLVLICPSGLGEEERLPVVDGVRRNDLRTIIDSVFCDPRQIDAGLVSYYREQFTNRQWRVGLLRTIRGTMAHCVRDLLPRVSQPTLLVVGERDRIVDPCHAEAVARTLPRGHFVVVPDCGHADRTTEPVAAELAEVGSYTGLAREV